MWPSLLAYLVVILSSQAQNWGVQGRCLTPVCFHLSSGTTTVAPSAQLSVLGALESILTLPFVHPDLVVHWVLTAQYLQQKLETLCFSHVHKWRWTEATISTTGVLSIVLPGGVLPYSPPCWSAVIQSLLSLMEYSHTVLPARVFSYSPPAGVHSYSPFLPAGVRSYSPPCRSILI